MEAQVQNLTLMGFGLKNAYIKISTTEGIKFEADVALPVVQGFEPDRYLGTWYEIARLDHGFERGLSKVTATYSLREDGGVRVVNRGYDAGKGEWDETEGKAYFLGDEDVGLTRLGVMAIGAEDEGLAVGGPHREAIEALGESDALHIFAREVHHPEVELAAAVRGEGDAPSVGRERTQLHEPPGVQELLRRTTSTRIHPDRSGIGRRAAHRKEAPVRGEGETVHVALVTAQAEEDFESLCVADKDQAVPTLRLRAASTSWRLKSASL